MPKTGDKDESQLGDYVLLSRIAVGGMAEVFIAKPAASTEPGRRLAIKRLLPQYARDPELMLALADEARLNVELSHPNLVRVFEFDVVHGQPYLAMELVDGPSLEELHRRILAQGETMPLSATLFVVTAILQALSYTHEARDSAGECLHIVHRDVSPQNVLLTRHGGVKLGDFGIARSAVRSVRTRTGNIKGKLSYLAPEQATGSSIDARTDLYNVGLILFELLTGRPYLHSESEVEALRHAAQPRFTAPSSLSDAPPELDAVVQRALKRFPEERFQSARAFASNLARVATALGVSGDADALARLLASTPELPTVEQDLSPIRRPTSDTVPDRPVIARSTRTARRGAGPWLIAAGLVGLLLTAVAFWLGLAPATRDQVPTEQQATPPSTPPAPNTQMTSDRVRESTDRPPRRPPSQRRSKQPARRLATSKTRDEGSLPHQKLRERLQAIRSGLFLRGILITDLSAAQRAALEKATKLIEDRRVERARVALDELNESLARLAVDGGFVEGKLRRIDRLIQAADRERVEANRIEELAQTALDEYMAGRYEAANRHLNRIAKLIAPR